MTIPANEHTRRAWTRVLGKRRLDELERALMDPRLVSLRQELARVDVLLADVEEEANDGASRENWIRARELSASLTGALLELAQGLKALGVADAPDPERLTTIAQELQELTIGAMKAWQARDEIARLLELRRKLSDTERKYEEMEKLAIPHPQLLLLFHHLHEAICAVLPDRKTQLALLQEVRIRCNGEERRPLAIRYLPESYLAAGTTLDPAALADSDPVELEQRDADDAALAPRSPDRSDLGGGAAA